MSRLICGFVFRIWINRFSHGEAHMQTMVYKILIAQSMSRVRAGQRLMHFRLLYQFLNNWAAPSEFGTYRVCEQRRFRRACASAQSRQNLRCSLIQAVSQEEPSDRKPDPWPLWMAGHAQLKFVMTECSKTQIRLAGLNCNESCC